MSNDPNLTPAASPKASDEDAAIDSAEEMELFDRELAEQGGDVEMGPVRPTQGRSGRPSRMFGLGGRAGPSLSSMRLAGGGAFGMPSGAGKGPADKIVDQDYWKDFGDPFAQEPQTQTQATPAQTVASTPGPSKP